MPSPDFTANQQLDNLAGVNADLTQLVAATADLCRKPWRHGVRDVTTDCHQAGWDRTLLLEVRSVEGERRPELDLELDLYRSGDQLHLTLAWSTAQGRPMLWHGEHPIWMDEIKGTRCERPTNGCTLEALARRLRALLETTS